MLKLSRLIVLGLIMTAVALPNALAAFESPTKSAKDSGTALGGRLVNRYLSDVQHKDVADLRVFVSPAFQAQRTVGSPQTKAEFLRNLPELRSYKLRRLRVTRKANVLVVTCQAATDEIINGAPLSTGYSPRLATFIRGAKGWRITAYANFNTPR